MTNTTGKMQDTAAVSAIPVALLAFFLFACLDTSAKWLVVAGHAVLFVVWVRFTIQAVVLFLAYRGWQNRRLWSMNNPPLQILRGILLPVMTYFNFLSLQDLQLAQTISILLASPIVVGVLAGPLLGEWAGPRRWAAIIVGFIGVLMVVRPGGAEFGWPIIFILISMLSYSVYLVLTRKLASVETPESLIFYSCLFGVVFYAPFALPDAALPTVASDWVAFALAGLSGMLGHMALIRASRMAGASRVTPFMYSQILWMTLFGFVLFGDVPDGWTIAGGLVICAAGLYLMNRERQILREQRASR